MDQLILWEQKKLFSNLYCCKTNKGAKSLDHEVAESVLHLGCEHGNPNGGLPPRQSNRGTQRLGKDGRTDTAVKPE
jgi:hypothetical protein